MMGMYQLKKDRKYVIYGAGFMGKFVLDGLYKAGYVVNAFLDRRAEEIQEVESIPVYNPNTFINDDKENTVMIVAIMNPFEQPVVAKNLVDFGYRKVIYKMSANNRYQSEYARNMFEIYENILDGQIDENSTVFEYEDSFRNIYFEESGVIKKTDNEVIAFVPLELCYEEPKAWVPEPEERLDEAFDTPVFFSEKWIINLFRGFEGYGNVGEAIQEFKEYVRRNPWRYYSFPMTEQGINEVVHNRHEAFLQMNQILNYGMEFFIRNPVKVVWDQRGHFILIDGRHRASFFIAKGLLKIPARMSRADYECWRNEKKLKPCLDFLLEHDCLPAYAPIPHPNFYNYPTYRDTAGIVRIQRILEYFKDRNIDIKEMKILEIGAYFSYFAQSFYRMGADVTTVEFFESSFELGKRLNELLYCEGIKALSGDIEEVNLPDTYDMTVMLTVLYPYIKDEKGKNIMHKIDTVTTKMFLWESGDEPEAEKKFIMRESSFAHYEKIAETYGTGKSRELGIFFK